MTEFGQEDVARQLQLLEETLLDPAVRKDPARVGALLAEEFVEFGSSGRMWSRGAILELLAHEEGYAEAPLVREFECQPLALGVALVTYRAVRMDASAGKPRETLRSSVWAKSAQGWRMRFHQGTRVAGA